MPNRYRSNPPNLHPNDALVQLSLFPPTIEKIVNTNMLEKFLDEAVNAIKDIVKKEEIKNFLLPILFYKYLSDLPIDSSSTYNGLYLPLEYRWESLSHRRSSETIGQFITKAMHAIASLNPSLQNVLDCTNYEECCDADLKCLVDIVNHYQLANGDNLNFCHTAYEHLLQLLPAQSQNIGESFYTPKEVVNLMMKLILKDLEGTFYDPSCGSGCLSSLVRNLNLKLDDQNKEARIVGQDQASLASAVTKMDLLFDSHVKIYTQDSFREPLLDKDDSLRRFHYIFTNIPWNQSGYNKVFYKQDLWKRFDTAIVPPGNTADWGWLQHILASLEDNGQAAVLIDLGALSRGSGSEFPDSERDIRKVIIERNTIEAVISLPENLFYGTAAPCGLLIFDLKKSENHKDQILFIDALNTSRSRKGRKPFALSQEESDVIIEAYLNRTMEETFGHVASLEEIRSFDYDLSPALYVAEKVHIDYRSIDVIERELIEARKKRIDSDRNILEYFKYSTPETFFLKNVLKVHISDPASSRLDNTLRMLLISAEESRKQELASEIELRETISCGLFALNVENVRLGEYAEIGSGFTPEKKAREQAEKEQAKPGEKEEEYVSWVKAGDLGPEYILEVAESLPKKFTELSPRRAIRPVGTLLLALYGGPGTVGKTAILAIPAVLNQAVCSIQPREDILDRDYLFCYLTYIRRYWGRYLRGSRQNINLLIVKKRLIPFLGIKQQQEIAAKLQPYNERIRGLKQEIALLRQIL